MYFDVVGERLPKAWRHITRRRVLLSARTNDGDFDALLSVQAIVGTVSHTMGRRLEEYDGWQSPSNFAADGTYSVARYVVVKYAALQPCAARS